MNFHAAAQGEVTEQTPVLEHHMRGTYRISITSQLIPVVTVTAIVIVMLECDGIGAGG